MSKEEDLERFDLEYSLFEVDCVSSLEEVNSYIEIFSDDLDEYIAGFRREIKLNRLEKFRAMLANHFAVIVGYEFPEYYDEDSKVIKEEVKVVNSFKKSVSKLLDIINDSNCSDVFKLIKFIRDKYYDYYSYLEKERNGVELQYSGIYMNVPVPFDLNSFFEFINGEIKRISLNNNVEKKKTI